MRQGPGARTRSAGAWGCTDGLRRLGVALLLEPLLARSGPERPWQPLYLTELQCRSREHCFPWKLEGRDVVAVSMARTLCPVSLLSGKGCLTDLPGLLSMGFLEKRGDGSRWVAKNPFPDSLADWGWSE